MQPGRRPKPTALKLLAGNPGHRPINDAEPDAPAARPDAPDYLDEVASTEWDRVCGILAQMGLLSSADRSALAAYCVCYSRWVDAEKKVKQSGTIVKSPDKGVPIYSPYLNVANRAMEQMVKLSVEFGLTPSSRSRIRLPPGSKKNKLSTFLDKSRRA